MSAPKKKRQGSVDKAVKLTPDQLNTYSKKTWKELEYELNAAYDEVAASDEMETEKNKSLSKSEKEEMDKVAETEFQSLLSAYRDVHEKRINEIHPAFENPKEVAPGKSIKIDKFKLGLPDTLKELNPEAEEDMFYYLPTEIRSAIIFHGYMLEIYSHFLPEYISQPSKNVVETIDFHIEAAKSNGLFFRKMHVVKGNYAVIFYNFTDRTDEVMIEDYKKNAHMMMYDESAMVKKKMNEIEERQAADSIQDEVEGDMILLDGEQESSVEIKEYEVLFKSEDVSSYLYSSAAIAIFYSLERSSVPNQISDRTAVIIRPEKYPKMRGKFHNMYILPSC